MKNDVSFVVIMVAFFALAALFVVVCDRIIGADEEALDAGDVAIVAPEPEELAA